MTESQRRNEERKYKRRLRYYEKERAKRIIQNRKSKLTRGQPRKYNRG